MKNRIKTHSKIPSRQRNQLCQCERNWAKTSSYSCTMYNARAFAQRYWNERDSQNWRRNFLQLNQRDCSRSVFNFLIASPLPRLGGSSSAALCRVLVRHAERVPSFSAVQLPLPLNQRLSLAFSPFPTLLQLLFNYRRFDRYPELVRYICFIIMIPESKNSCQ